MKDSLIRKPDLPAAPSFEQLALPARLCRRFKGSAAQPSVMSRANLRLVRTRQLVPYGQISLSVITLRLFMVYDPDYTPEDRGTRHRCDHS